VEGVAEIPEHAQHVRIAERGVPPAGIWQDVYARAVDLLILPPEPDGSGARAGKIQRLAQRAPDRDADQCDDLGPTARNLPPQHACSRSVLFGLDLVDA
jgi:hypothetical protein